MAQTQFNIEDMEINTVFYAFNNNNNNIRIANCHYRRSYILNQSINQFIVEFITDIRLCPLNSRFSGAQSITSSLNTISYRYPPPY
jgi:hypothetical protein